MKYISTRGNYKNVTAAEAIRLGMVPPGGLFVPAEIPQLAPAEIEKMKEYNYQETAKQVLSKFLTDYTEEELREAISAAYNSQNFASPEITPIYKLSEKTYVLELWHGPTAAFKDLALQLMPHLLVQAINKIDLKRKILILVATSGDTGKAALEGFKDVPGIEIIVFYPQDGVSKIQKHQMETTKGDNTYVVAVEGNFDDCQNSVKEIFGDEEFKQVIKEQGYQFSSANSINWGRLVPQIIYYFNAYARLLAKGEIEAEEEINIVVPTGNFGNILAAYYAYRMGLPVNKFICASNDNRVLADFFATGTYDIKREFKKTISPSMDILISSNLERFLFEVTGQDAEKINSWYEELNQKQSFSIDEQTQAKISEIFVGLAVSEAETKQRIKDTYQQHDYLIDTHTAVGVEAYQKYTADNNEQSKTIIAATANPYKFCSTVFEAISEQGSTQKSDEFEILEKLNKETDFEVHPSLKELSAEQIKHKLNCQVTEIKESIKELLALE
ncbi:threonine synthase [Fuchsiella alkaliacetigena]|uniref:threonine synthase n=1 Tax=Fuchsiella alkaliacetigena TaxID=957042 RepID=UPI00200B0AA7|nr:threonine synthase [Fuchsiella alkaliacetigena]MCK8823888.1 threonine synthase [Fuchsiella alkaliacetigena]